MRTYKQRFKKIVYIKELLIELGETYVKTKKKRWLSIFTITSNTRVFRTC